MFRIRKKLSRQRAAEGWALLCGHVLRRCALCRRDLRGRALCGLRRLALRSCVLRGRDLRGRALRGRVLCRRGLRRLALRGRALHWSASPKLMGRILLAGVVGVMLGALCFGGTSSYAASTQDAQDAGIQNRYKLLQDLEGIETHAQGSITETRISVLVSVNKALDGRVVAFDGEAVGEIIRENARKCWVNILGTDGSMIGVEMTYEDAAQIKDFGDYHKKGTTLHIEGLYSVACKEHQGELDVHASSVSVLSEGSEISHPIYEEYIPLIAIGFGIIFVLIALFLLLRHKQSKKKKKKRRHENAIYSPEGAQKKPSKSERVESGRSGREASRGKGDEASRKGKHEVSERSGDTR